jgi:uncharacterized membrane protein YbhN (UPF0104 family)
VIFIVVVGFSRQDFNNGIGVVIRVSVCLQIFFFPLLSSRITRRREEREKTNKEKKLRRHTKISMMVLLVSLQRSRQNESNDTK